jgi:regulator of CtrA degradation
LCRTRSGELHEPKLGINPEFFKGWLVVKFQAWHSPVMQDSVNPMIPFTMADVQMTLTPKVISALYQEAMALAEDARDYFDHVGQWDRKRLQPMDRVLFSCESLKVTTRLMHVISWLLVRKAVLAGEMSPAAAMTPDRRLGRTTKNPQQDSPRIKTLPPMAQRLIAKSQELYVRIKRLEEQMEGDETESDDSPARQLQQKLAAAF